MAHVFHHLEDLLSKTKSETYSADKKLVDLFYNVIIKVQSALELYQINNAEEIDFSELVAQIEKYDNKKIIVAKKYKIAIIDDDKNTRDILKEILQLEIQANFTEYEDAHLILKELENTKFDLILTDYKMPIIDGNTFIKALRLTKNINSNTPVMFITGESPDFLPAKDVVKDVYFIQKPFAFSRILYYAKLSLPRN
jgi:CheY-like chemotaxis protein